MYTNIVLVCINICTNIRHINIRIRQATQACLHQEVEHHPGDLLYRRDEHEDGGGEEVAALLEEAEHVRRPLPQHAVVHHVLHGPAAQATPSQLLSGAARSLPGQIRVAAAVLAGQQPGPRGAV